MNAIASIQSPSIVQSHGRSLCGTFAQRCKEGNMNVQKTRQHHINVESTSTTGNCVCLIKLCRSQFNSILHVRRDITILYELLLYLIHIIHSYIGKWGCRTGTGNFYMHAAPQSKSRQPTFLPERVKSRQLPASFTDLHKPNHESIIHIHIHMHMHLIRYHFY